MRQREPPISRIAAARAAHSGGGRRRFSATFELTLFGRPAAVFLPDSGAAVPVVWRLRRAFELVALLAMAPERWAADETVAEALWPDMDRDVISRNLNPTVSDARGALAAAAGHKHDTVVRAQGGFALSHGVDWTIDVDDFRADAGLAQDLLRAAPERALACGRRAWRRVRGRILEGLASSWIDVPRDNLERQYLRLLSTVAEAALVLDRGEEAMDAYRTILVADAYDERAHVALMEIYGRDRRPDLVRRQFMRLEDLLRELDVEPREETRARYLALVSQAAKKTAVR